MPLSAKLAGSVAGPMEKDPIQSEVCCCLLFFLCFLAFGKLRPLKEIGNEAFQD